MDQLDSGFNILILWTSLVVGMTASLHCIGMCGPLVMTVTKNILENIIYQVGRLTGYLMVTVFIGLIGAQLWGNISVDFKTTFIILIAIFYCFIGIQQFFGKKYNLKLPSFFNKYLQSITIKTINSKLNSKIKSFSFGFLSVLLPCGVLYSFILGIVSVYSLPLAVLTVLFFWIGTVPALTIVSGTFQKALSPMKNIYPRIIGISYLGLGLSIIFYRYYITMGAASCH